LSNTSFLKKELYVHGWTVFREEARMPVRLCPWMDGIPRRGTDAGAVMSFFNG